MTRKQYLDALYRGLKWMPEPDRLDALADYEEHFDAGLIRGRSEEEIAANLGDPADIVQMFRTQSRLAAAQATVTRARRSRSAASMLNAVLAGIGLGFVNLIIIVPVFFALAAAVIALYAAAASIAVSGVAVMISGIFFPVINLGSPGVTTAILIFTGAGLLCLGILACVGCWYVSKYFAVGMMKYIEFNIEIVRGRSQRRAMKARPAAPPEAIRDTSGKGDARRTGSGGWMRRAGDALDTAAEKTAQGIRQAGMWAAGKWKKCKTRYTQCFSKEKEE